MCLTRVEPRFSNSSGEEAGLQKASLKLRIGTKPTLGRPRLNRKQQPPRQSARVALAWHRRCFGRLGRCRPRISGFSRKPPFRLWIIA